MNDGTAEGEMCILAAVTYPSLWSVSQVEEAVQSNDLNALLTLMEDVMGGCDTVLHTAESPWPTEGGQSCHDLEQTQSNVID